MPPDDKPTSPAAPSALARGASIGRYVVLGLVGKGGMGEVYAAYDPELDRKVAVKLLRSQPGNGVSQSEGRARILREAQAIAKLSHPNVVVVFDVGTFQDQVFIAMEFLEGHTVGHWLRERERSWKDVLRVFLAAGRGLQAAHEKDLVHRDFKPDNVMVDKDGGVRVMDFGLARQVTDKPAAGDTSTATQTRTPTPPPTTTAPRVMIFSEDGHEVAGAGDTLPAANGAVDSTNLKWTRVATPPPAAITSDDNADGKPLELLARQTSSAFEAHLTRTGSMMGTPAYMAAEQFLGKPTDARTDQFSFCVALYEGLYGERPFAGKTLFGLTSAVVQGQISEAPANSKVPGWIRKILLRGLNSDPNDRYPSMTEVLAALGRDPAAARRKTALITGALMLPLIVGVGVRQSTRVQAMCTGGPEKLVGIWELEGVGRQAESARKLAIRTAMLSTKKAYAKNVYANVRQALDAYAKSWSEMYQEACEATHVRGDQSADVLDLRMSCLDDRLDNVKALTAIFTQATDEVVEKALAAVHDLPTVERCADVPLLRMVVRPPDDAKVRAQVDNLRHRLAEARALDDAGRWTSAIEIGTEVENRARVLRYSPLLAESLSLFGSLQSRTGNVESAERSLQEGYWAAETSRHDEVRAEIATELVWVAGFQQGRHQEAESWARHADAAIRRLGGHDRLRSWLLNNVAAVYELQGRSSEALRLHQEALALKEKVLPTGHPDIALSLANTAIAFQALGRHNEALSHIDRAIGILEKALGRDHPDFANQLSNRGEILRGLDRPVEARSAFEEAAAIWERELGRDHLILSYALTGIGEALLDEGRNQLAVAPLERAATLRDEKDTALSRRAETHFALARAIWSTHPPDQVRSDDLATKAKTEYAEAVMLGKVAEIQRWLADRVPPKKSSKK